WIGLCGQTHPQCRTGVSERLPTRVLDLGEPDGSVLVRLYEPPSGANARYVALSYCWGQAGNLTTTTRTIAARKTEISWALLPKTFRDAVLIARGLGVRYLWIDSLCIIQDSPSDWEAEAARMAEVHENAYMTIATDAAYDPTCGILKARQSLEPVRRDPLQVLRPTDEICVRRPLSHQDIIMPRVVRDSTFPLLTRAWTLQERLLAHRTLHFTAFELIWECKETLFCECQ
ncbi:HET-domain-containing protein, partial [Cryphonectria parasitica EP155]